MPQSLTFRDVTHNQSTMDVTQEIVFLGENYFQTANVQNDEGITRTVKTGMIVQRDAADSSRVYPYVSANEDLDRIVGILFLSSEVELDAGRLENNINYAYTGIVDATKILYSDGTVADLDAFVGTTTKTLRDRLHELGFNTLSTTENTKLDN